VEQINWSDHRALHLQILQVPFPFCIKYKEAHYNGRRKLIFL
jgi:hypothetical protein